MATKSHRVVVVLSILVLIGMAGGGTYWVVKKGLNRENAQHKVEQLFGQRKPDKLPESFEEGPAHSSLLAEHIREALAAVRRDPRGATEPLRQAALALIRWKRGLACSHNLRWGPRCR